MMLIVRETIGLETMVLVWTMKPGRTRLTQSVVRNWAKRYYQYGYGVEEPRLFEAVGPAAAKRGFYRRNEFISVVSWKSPRTGGLAARNSAAEVEYVTRAALGAPEPLKASLLSVLVGVQTPVASAILAVADPSNFTIIDWRAEESLRHFGYLQEFESGRVPYGPYLELCRGTAKRLGVRLRELDRCLWTFSKVVLSPGSDKSGNRRSTPGGRQRRHLD